MNINGIRLSSSYCVTWLGITDPQTKLRLNIRHDFQAHILKGSHAIRVEHQMFLQFFTNASRPASFISSSKVSFDFFHCATRRIPIVRSRMKCQKRAPSRRHDRSQQVSCCRIVTFSAVFAMPPTGSSAIWRQCRSPHTRESHECCVHLLQELQIDGCPHDFRRLFSCPLQHHLRLLDHTRQRTPPYSSTTVENSPLCQRVPSDDKGLSSR